MIVMLFNRDNAYDEVTIIPEVEEETVSLEEQWRDMIVEKVDNLLQDYITSEIIVDNCMEKTENYILCIKNVVWVATAESSLFKRVSRSNNPFGLMKGWRLQKFASKYDAIIYRIELYSSKRTNRTKWEDRILGRYCTSECDYWVSNYNDWIAKLKFN